MYDVSPDEPEAPARTMKLFDWIFTAMGTILLGIAGWIGLSVAHIPVIEQKLTDYIASADKHFEDNDTLLHDHETRIRTLEHKR